MQLPVHGTFAEIATASAWGQRWDHRRHSWRHRSEGGFDSSRYHVDPLSESTAKPFVTLHHYTGTYPAASRRYGLFDAATSELVGAAVFGIPTRMEVLTNVLPELVPIRESLVLPRFVLTPGPGNQESWFLARCFEDLASHGIAGVVSFADPVPRLTHAGRIICPGHVGWIYQATNATYTGRGTPRSIIVLPDGTTLNDRSLQKVRRQERGHAYVETRLIGLGASPPRALQNPTDWLATALETIGARRLRHRGCHRYVFRLGATARARRAVQIALPSGPYPKAIDLP